MKTTNLFFLFLFLTLCTFGQKEKVAQRLTIEHIFNNYLVSENKSDAQFIINSKDSLYSLYCQGNLTEDLTEKINLFTKFIELNPKYGLANGYLKRGIAYTLSKKYSSAIEDYTKSIELNPKEEYTFYFRGEAYNKQKKYDKAIEDFTTAVKIKPDFLLGYYMRGISFSDKEDNESALADFNKVIEMDKTFDQVYLMRGMVYDDMKEYKKAISDWKEAKKLNKENSKFVDERIESTNKKMKAKQ